MHSTLSLIGNIGNNFHDINHQNEENMRKTPPPSAPGGKRCGKDSATSGKGEKSKQK